MEIISIIWIIFLVIWMLLSWKTAWTLSMQDNIENSAFLNHIDSFDKGQRGLVKINIGLLLLSFVVFLLFSSLLFLIHQIIVIGIMFANTTLIRELQKLEEE